MGDLGTGSGVLGGEQRNPSKEIFAKEGKEEKHQIRVEVSRETGKM